MLGRYFRLEFHSYVYIEKSPNTFSRWWVPISYTVAGGNFSQTENKIWLSPKDEAKTVVLTDIKDPKLTLIFNVQHQGFYRLVT